MTWSLWAAVWLAWSPAVAAPLECPWGYPYNMYCRGTLVACEGGADATFIVPNTNPWRLIMAEYIVDELNAAAIPNEDGDASCFQLEEMFWYEDAELLDFGFTHYDAAGGLVPRSVGHPNAYDGDDKTVVPGFADGGYDALFIGWGMSKDPHYNPAYLSGHDGNFYNLSSSRLDRVAISFEEETDPAARLQEGYELQALMHELEPAILLGAWDDPEVPSSQEISLNAAVFHAADRRRLSCHVDKQAAADVVSDWTEMEITPTAYLPFWSGYDSSIQPYGPNNPDCWEDAQ